MTPGQLNSDETLPTPRSLQETLPLSPEQRNFILESRQTIESILEGADSRKLLIVGPCSIHDCEATLEYGNHFQELAKEVSDQFFMVMRTYFEKPRTILGWKGFLYDPDLDGSHNVAKGIHLTRHLLSELTTLRIPTASELLDMATAPYFSDFLSWGCIGARTCSSPSHRQLAASLDFPVGFKNSTDGCIDNAVHGVLSASVPHVYLGLSSEGKFTRIKTEGNPLCHLVLRGGYNGPNYDYKSVQESTLRCQQMGIRDKVVIDCSHDNCEKMHLKQIPIFQEVTQQIIEGNESIVGLMLESHLFSGSQSLSHPLQYGVSITDPCLDWLTTREVILQAAERLQRATLCFI